MRTKGKMKEVGKEKKEGGFVISALPLSEWVSAEVTVALLCE